MGQSEVSVDIDHSADAVWNVVRDFGGIAQWMPGIDSCTLSGDKRTLATRGIEIVERNLGVDDEARTASYGIVGGGLSVDHHEATVTVSERSPDTCRVVWSFSVEPETLMPVLSQSYGGALQALARYLDT